MLTDPVRVTVLGRGLESVNVVLPSTPSPWRSNETFENVGSAGMAYPPTVSTALKIRSGPPATMAVLIFMAYAPPAVSVFAVTVTVCPDAILVLSTVISPPPPVAVIEPCSWQVVPVLSTMR